MVTARTGSPGERGLTTAAPSPPGPARGPPPGGPPGPPHGRVRRVPGSMIGHETGGPAVPMTSSTEPRPGAPRPRADVVVDATGLACPRPTVNLAKAILQTTICEQ